jgi:bifunctional non-homologous end joining protein LigD
MTTGSKGLHVVIPIQPKHDFDQIRTFAREKAQTAVAPYSLRAIENAPVATPLDWSELSSLDNAQKYNLSNIFRRLAQKQDPWQNLYKKKNTTISL